MRIRVLNNFGGVLTNEKRILPGVYDANDPRLFGITDYLVENKHAIVVSDDTALTELVESRPVEDNAFHNKLMAAKGRPQIVELEAEDEPDPIPDVTPREIEFDALSIEYERLFGKKAPGNIKKVETLRQRIAEAENDTGEGDSVA